MLHATMSSGKDNEASASTTSTSRPNPTSLGKYPEILAYRYNGRTVYVLPAETYEVSRYDNSMIPLPIHTMPSAMHLPPQALICA